MSPASLLLSLISCAILSLPPTSGLECNQKILDRSFVTQCKPSICEPLLDGTEVKPQEVDDQETGGLNPVEWPTSKDEIVHVVSSRAGDRFKVNRYKDLNTIEFFYEENHVNATMFVQPDVKYQRILGFGTTLTDASCANVDELPVDIRQKLIDDCFSPKNGIGLNLIKIPIGSTKFSYTNYALDQLDEENQVELSPYDIDHRIPLIKDALKSAGRLRNRIKLIASATTAPPSCKQNNRLIHGGLLREDKYHAYASYLMGFAQAYHERGLDLWSLMLSESPVSVARDKEVNETLDYNSMAMRPSDARKLISAIEQLGTSRQFSGRDIKLLLLGDDRSNIPVWADSVLGQTKLSAKIAGIAYTCNSSDLSSYDNLVYFNKRFPSKYLLTTSGTINGPQRLGDWQYAENYATEMVKNLEYGSVGWIEANMALNLDGGPTISPRFKADASIIIDQKKAAYYRNPMFYAIGHLSRYVKPGSVRVKVDLSSSAHMYARQHIAFLTPENYVVVFMMNNNIGPMGFNIGVNKRTKAELLLETKSFNTFIIKL